MNPGKLRYRVQIEGRAEEKDSLGQVKDVWRVVLTTWAGIRNRSGREVLNSAEPMAEISTEIIVRYNSSIDDSMRVRYGSEYYTIKYALANPERTWMQLMCVSGLRDG